MLSSTDASGRATRYAYDAYGNLETITDPLNQVTRLGYDLVGRLTVITDTNGHATRYAYNAGDNLTRITDARNGETNHTYDDAGNLETVTDANGHSTSFSYYADDRLQAITNALGKSATYAYDDAGNLGTVTDATGRSLTYTYDQVNRLETARDALGNTTRYDYDAVGNLTVITDANGIETHYGYDELNRLVRVVENFDDGLEDAVPDQDVITRYGYDAVGNRTVITDANHHVARLYYDDLNRLESRSDPLNHTWGYVYGPVGNLTQVTDPQSQITTYHYDDLNRLTTIDYPASQGDVTFTYDPAGNRQTMSDPTGLTGYVYDELNRLTSVTPPGVGTVGYHYDGVGNLTQLDYPNTQSVIYAYDAADRLETVTDWGGQYTYRYDEAGRLTGLSAPDDVNSGYHYDGAGRLVCLDHTPAGNPRQALASYRYTLDAVGNRTQAVESQVACIRVYYFPIVLKNATGEMMTVYDGVFDSPLPTPTATPAAPARIEDLIEALDVAYTQGQIDDQGVYEGLRARLLQAQDYLGQGKPRKAARELEAFIDEVETQGGVHVVQEAADGLIALAEQLLLQGEGQSRRGSVGLAAPLPAGQPNLLARLVEWLEANLFNPGPVARGDVARAAPLVFNSPIGGQGLGGEVVIDYTYDDLYRLTSAVYSSGESYAYGYDPVGNRMQQTVNGVVTGYTYDAADRLTSANGVAYTWDDNGNLTGDGTRSYTYDAADRLTAASGQGLAAGYIYNGDGLRVGQTINGQGTAFTWDVAAPLPQVLTTSGGAAYVYGLGLLAQQQGGTWQYPLADGLGSLRHWTDATGQVTYAVRYAPFGGLLHQQGTAPGPWGYAGEMADPTGLIYLRARWYDPGTGRFLTRDPFPGLAALPSTQHPYVYVGNNPVNLIDPSGQIAPILVAAGIGAAIGGVAGGVGYVLAHPGGRPEDYLRDAGFRRAVGVGMLSGVVAGAVGFWVGGVAAGTGLGGAIAGGIWSGAAAGAVGQTTANLLTPCVDWHDNLAEAAIFGGLTGGDCRRRRLRRQAVDGESHWPYFCANQIWRPASFNGSTSARDNQSSSPP